MLDSLYKACKAERCASTALSKVFQKLSRVIIVSDGINCSFPMIANITSRTATISPVKSEAKVDPNTHYQSSLSFPHGKMDSRTDADFMYLSPVELKSCGLRHISEGGCG